MPKLDEVRKRIRRVIRAYAGRVELDCPGDCWMCPAAQTVRCWMTSKDTVERFESHQDEEELMSEQKYTREELEGQGIHELFKIGGAEVGIPRDEVYSMPREELIQRILDKLGAEGEAKKPPSEKKGKKGPVKKKLKGSKGGDGESGDATEDPPGKKKPPKKAPTAGKKPAPKKVRQTQEDDPEDDHAKIYPEVGVINYDEADATDLLHAAIMKISQTMGGGSPDHEEALSALDGQIDKLQKRCAKLEGKCSGYEFAWARLVTILEGITELDDLEGDTPYQKIKDLAERYGDDSGEAEGE